MQKQKIVITLHAGELQDVERIVADRDGTLAIQFVTNVIKPKVDAARDKGHCKPIFEWHRGQPEKIQPPPRSRRL